MAQPLSTAASHEIEHVIRLCQRLEFFVSQPPVTVRALSQGESNQSFYISTAQSEYVLRSYPVGSDICRHQELRCQHAAAAKGLAPAPLCLNNHYQVMLSEYIPNGVAYDYTQHGSTLLLNALAAFHQLSVQTPQLEYARYLQQLIKAVPATFVIEPLLLAALQRAATKLQLLSTDIVLCHLDLHAGNLLFAADKLWLLDFEYSQLADSSLDLAAISLHFNLTEQQEQLMLAEYVGYRGVAELLEPLRSKLFLAKQLYCGFCWLWYLAVPGYEAQAKRWQQRLQHLE